MGPEAACVNRSVRTALYAVYVLALPVLLIGVFAGGFATLAEIEEWDGERMLTVYGSPITPLFVGAAAGPVVLLAYQAYWLVRHISRPQKRRPQKRQRR